MPITDAPIDSLFDHIAGNLSALRLEVLSLRRRLTATQAERDTLRLQVASSAGLRPRAPLGTPLTADCGLCHRAFIVRSNRQRVCETCRPVEHRSIEQVAAARQLDVVTTNEPGVPGLGVAEAALPARRCLGCGNPFRPVDRRGDGPRGGRVAQRCEPCRAERQKQIQKDWREAKAGRTRVSAPTPERVTPARVTAPAPSVRPTAAQTLERYGKPGPVPAAPAPAAPAPAPSVVTVVVRPEPRPVTTQPLTSATDPAKTVERRCGRCCAKFKARDTNEYFCADCLEIRKHMKARHGRVVLPDEEPAVERTAWTGRGAIPDDRVGPNDTGMGSTLGGGQFSGKGF